MKKSLYLLGFIFLSASSLSVAQVQKIWGDPHVAEKFSAEAIKDPAYVKLKTDAAALSKTANGPKTNADAARALFIRNSALLKGLYKKTNIEAPKPMSANRPSTHTLTTARIRSSAFLSKLLLNQQNTKTATPPYKDSWRWSDQAGFNNIYPDTSGSVFSIAKTEIVYETPYSDYAIRTGQYFQGYLQQFTIPSDPLIVAAEVKFEYSFIYSGWDTYGARLGMDLIVEATNLNGSEYNALPDYDDAYQYNEQWKMAGVLYPADTIDTEFGEFYATGNSSFTIEGYVIPGQVIDVKLGCGFIKNAARGLNGSYHYAEFILKKITVKYFKNGN